MFLPGGSAKGSKSHPPTYVLRERDAELSSQKQLLQEVRMVER